MPNHYREKVKIKYYGGTNNAFGIFILLLLSTVSCTIDTRKEDDLKTFDLSILPKVTILKLSDLGFRNIKYIPLQTTDTSLILGKFYPLSFYKILPGDDFFIIRQYSTVLKFRDDGAFEQRIGTIGRGPGEFQICHDIDIDQSGAIYIADGWKETFFKYSANGELVKTFKSPLIRAPLEFIYFEGRFLCYNQNAQANIINSYNLIDSSGSIIKSYPNKYPFTRHDGSGFTYENIFYRFNDHIFKKEVYCDTIFMYDGLCFKPHIVIKVGKKLITPEIRSSTDGFDIGKNYIYPFKLFEFGDFIYYEFANKLQPFSGSEKYAFVASKKNAFQALINSETGLINDLDGGPCIIPITIKNDSTIIAMVDAGELKNYVASDLFKKLVPKYPQKKIELEKLAQSLKETDNPVLMMVSLK